MGKVYSAGGETSITANFSTNEEKIKEMWDKLVYCLCKCETSVLLRIAHHLFTIITVYHFICRTFCEQFVLRKLDFESLINEIYFRFIVTYFTIINTLIANDSELPF